MLHRKPQVDPRMHTHFLRAIQEEQLAIVSLLRFLWPLVLLFVIGVASLIYLARPLPPTKIKLATGQPNSSLEALGNKYADYFKKNGVQIEQVNTAGAFENIELIKQGKVDAAFSLGGIPVGETDSRIVSLGSVEYQPLWMFYRGAEFTGDNPTVFFQGKKFSINIPGSGTRHLTEIILSMHDIRIDGNPSMLSLSSGASVEALLSGKIDGLFLVAGIDSKTIQGVLSHPEIKVFNFSVAEAYAKRLRHLEVLSLPHGSIDLKRSVPPRNISMVATTTTILVNEKLHPAIQHLFLESARKMDDEGHSFFQRAGRFPAYIERSIPVSSVADRYYSKGPPALTGYVPFWIASFFDQIWFFVFAAFAIGYPLVKIVPNYRAVYAHFCMTDCYEELAEIDLHLVDTLPSEKLKLLVEKFDALEQRIESLWVPAGLYADQYFLRGAAEIVREKANRLLEDSFASRQLSEGQ